MITLKTSNDSLDTEENPLTKKILFERRKRTQAYTALDYFLSFYSYFDFFSSDTFTIAKHSKYLAQSYKKNSVGKEFLLFPFLESETEIAEILRENKFSKRNIKNLMPTPKENELKTFTFAERFLLALKLPFFVKKIHAKKSTRFSEEIYFIFEKAAENALTRFKTPVITPEILLITLLEENEFFKSFRPIQIEWLLLRYKFIKRIHYQEVNIRSQVVKNQQYFAYLFKTKISEIQFNRLIERDVMSPGILLFRNKLIRKILEQNIAKCIKQEILRSIKITASRKYSS